MTAIALSAPTAQRFRFSELLREPKVVTAATDRGPVYLDRRDNDELVLMKRIDADVDRQGLEIVAQVMGLITLDPSLPLAERVAQVFAWTKFLHADDLDAFVDEVIETARACAALAFFTPLIQLIRQWRATAEAYAAGWDQIEYEWLDPKPQVGRPEMS